MTKNQSKLSIIFHKSITRLHHQIYLPFNHHYSFKTVTIRKSKYTCKVAKNRYQKLVNFFYGWGIGYDKNNKMNVIIIPTEFYLQSYDNGLLYKCYFHQLLSTPLCFFSSVLFILHDFTFQNSDWHGNKIILTIQPSFWYTSMINRNFLIKYGYKFWIEANRRFG